MQTGNPIARKCSPFERDCFGFALLVLYLLYVYGRWTPTILNNEFLPLPHQSPFIYLFILGDNDNIYHYLLYPIVILTMQSVSVKYYVNFLDDNCKGIILILYLRWNIVA